MIEKDSVELESFTRELNLKHIEGSLWEADTAHGRRAVLYTTANFTPVVAYKNGNRTFVARVSDLSPYSSELPSPRLWITRD